MLESDWPESSRWRHWKRLADMPGQDRAVRKEYLRIARLTGMPRNPNPWGVALALVAIAGGLGMAYLATVLP